MNKGAPPSTPPRPNSASPTPTCSICLDTCANMCSLNTCRHEFCFNCIMEWWKRKAECPLCKQPFEDVIYTIQSIDEYAEPFLSGTQSFSIRRLQFRGTVDPGCELAGQEMRPSHPRTNTWYNVPDNLPMQRIGSPQHNSYLSTISFRESIYMNDLWSCAPPDVTRLFRDITPDFYRENPAARNYLVPWLNRELNALLQSNTQLVKHLFEVIMDHLPHWHIQSRSFKQLLSPYLTNQTKHFIHEFYTFMCSPYNMRWHDLHIDYPYRPEAPNYLISDCEDDSDNASEESENNEANRKLPTSRGLLSSSSNESSRSHKDHESHNKEKSKSHMKTNFVSDSGSSDNERLSSRKRKMDFDPEDSNELKKKLKNCSGSQTTSSGTHTITSRNSPSTGEEDQPQNATEDEESTPSCSQYKYEQYQNDCICWFSHRDCSGYNWRLPSQANVGAGTSSIKNEIGEANYSNYYSGPSTSGLVQSVTVKKKEKKNSNIYRYYLNADTSDSED